MKQCDGVKIRRGKAGMSTFKAAGHTCCLHITHSSSDNNADVLNNLHWSNITAMKKNAKEHSELVCALGWNSVVKEVI